MTLEEAIKHCKEKAEEQRRWAAILKNGSIERSDCVECAEEHEQLAEWLRELKEWRDLKLICGFDGYVVYKCKE